MKQTLKKKHLKELFTILKNDDDFINEFKKYDIKLCKTFKKSVYNQFLKNFLNMLYYEYDYLYLDRPYLDIAYYRTLNNEYINLDEIWHIFKDTINSYE